LLCCIQAALLQKLKGQVGSEKMLDLMMTLLKPGPGQPESRSSAGPTAETGQGPPPLKMEGEASGFSGWVKFFCKLFSKNTKSYFFILKKTFCFFPEYKMIMLIKEGFVWIPC
jgi:hypothetical protein